MLGVDVCWASGMCKPAGEACRQDADCCFGECIDGLCQELECLPDGASCAFGDQCCNGVCLEDPNNPGELVCSPECVPEGGTCASNSDCCAGICNTDCCEGVCQDGFCGINTL